MGKVVPIWLGHAIRRGFDESRARALATQYPLPVDRVHLSAEGKDWRLTKNLGGHSASMRLTDAELDLVIAMGQLALLVRT